MGDCKRVHCILHYFSQRENRLGSHLWSRHGKSLRVCANEIRQHAYDRAKLAIFGMKIQSKGIYIRISDFCLCMVNLTHLLKHTVNILQIWLISSTQIFFRSPNVVFFGRGRGYTDIVTRQRTRAFSLRDKTATFLCTFINILQFFPA